MARDSSLGALDFVTRIPRVHQGYGAEEHDSACTGHLQHGFDRFAHDTIMNCSRSKKWCLCGAGITVERDLSSGYDVHDGRSKRVAVVVRSISSSHSDVRTSER